MRFWGRVDKSGECWIWTGPCQGKGYGQAPVPGGRSKRAHRVAWELVHGPIPDGISVLHHCDNPPCVRPKHLFLGTAADNNADMMAKGRQRPGITHAGNRGWSTRNRQRVIGAGNPAAKLAPEQVETIRARRLSGEPLSRLAVEFGVSETTISRIALGRSWR